MNYRFLIGAISIAAAVLSVACLIVGAFAVDFNFDAFSNPVNAIEYSKHYNMAYWFMILDMLGYYLLLLPLIYYLHQQYKFRTPWAGLFTFCGFAYVLIGSIGAVVLATTWPSLMQLYLKAGPNNYEGIVIVFSSITTAVTRGLWNILEALFAAVWFIGIGKLLYNESKPLGIFGIITGAATLIDAVGNIFNIGIIAETGLNVYLLASIVFVLVAGIRLVRLSRAKSFADHKPDVLTSSGKNKIYADE